MRFEGGPKSGASIAHLVPQTVAAYVKTMDYISLCLHLETPEEKWVMDMNSRHRNQVWISRNLPEGKADQKINFFIPTWRWEYKRLPGYEIWS